MIKLIGTNHRDVEDNPSDFGRLLFEEDFDALFVEGISSQALEKEKLNSFDELSEDIETELTEIYNDAQDIFYGLVNLKQGPEPDYVENEWLDEENRDSVTFLDDKRSYNHIEQSVVSGLRNNDIRFYTDGGLSKSSLDIMFENGEPTKQNYIDFLKNAIADDQMCTKELLYGAIDSSKRFSNGRRRFARNVYSNEEKAKELAVGLSGAKIDRWDVQDILVELRDSEYQDSRDQNWYNQISGYHDSNPGEDLLVIGGISHMVEGENTLAGMLEGEYGDDVSVEPFYEIRTTG